MWIKTLQTHHFRNLTQMHVSFTKGIQVIYGGNAQGKTNLLEALYVAGYGRSYRSHRDVELIQKDFADYRVAIDVQRGEVASRYQTEYQMGSPKKRFLNNKPWRRDFEEEKLFHAVLFSPDDLRLVNGSPDRRRYYLDVEIGGHQTAYQYHLSQYKRALLQRNMLLKENGSRDMIKLFEQGLVQHGQHLIGLRQELIEHLAPHVVSECSRLTKGQDQLILHYEPSTMHLENDLAKAWEQDKRVKQTTIGPHRDDLRLLLNEQDARVYASQGQMRTISLSLKYAAFKYLEARFSEKPVLFLDDVFSELDVSRKTQLLNTTDAEQIFITTADKRIVASDQAIWYRMEGGNFGRESSINRF